jgi:hypothetical protein
MSILCPIPLKESSLFAKFCKRPIVLAMKLLVVTLVLICAGFYTDGVLYDKGGTLLLGFAKDR